jgi:hypothetical protein
MSIADRIIDMRAEAKALGIRGQRLYLSDAKLRELEDWLARHPHESAHLGASERTFAGMKVVRSSKPGMSIGL